MTAEAFPLRVLVLHLAATFHMVRSMWFVQRTHDPLFTGFGSRL